MIKVLLADDNKISLEYFSSMIDWEAEGFQIISAAVDGEEAYLDFQKYRPELVITDVQMPGMTGIELAEQIKETAPETMIIFISSYEEFSYVRSALNLGVYDYLLKHETKKDKLCLKLKQIKKFLELRDSKKKYYEEGCLQTLLDENYDLSEMQEKEKGIFPYLYDLFLVEQDHILPVLSKMTGIVSGEVKENSFKKICYQAFPTAIAVIKIKEFQYALLLKASGDASETAYVLKNQLEEAFSESYSILIVSERLCIQDTVSHYKQDKTMMDQKYFYSKSVVLDYRFCVKSGDYWERDVEGLEGVLVLGNIDQICQAADKYFLKAIQMQNCVLLSKLAQAMFCYLEQSHEKEIDYKRHSFFHLYDQESIYFWYSAKEIIQWLKQKCMELSQIRKNNALYKYSKEIQSAISYIYQHYTNSSLSAEEIAEQVGMSLNRLNIIMREETGNTIWKMLTKARINKAKELLAVNEYTVTEIHSMVGYTTVSYFSRVFKKLCGITPQEYRKLNHSHTKL